MVRGIVPRQPAKTGRQEGKRIERSLAKTGNLRPDRPGQTPRPTPGKKKKPAEQRAKGYDPLAPERIAEILKRLDQLYPHATCALTHKSAWELLVATILSAQSTDANVNRVTPELFRKYPTVADFAALAPEQLEPDIRSTGFFRNKSKSVVGAAKKIVSEFGGQVPDEMDKLLTLPGVARKTANVVLGTWFHKAEGIVVDTHVTRVAHQLIWHGRKLCIARRPKCVDCALENICHAGDKTWTTVEIHRNATL
jgi:endonuclease-3